GGPPDGPWRAVLPAGPSQVVLVLLAELPALRRALVVRLFRVPEVPGRTRRRSPSASRRQQTQPSGKRHAEA
ncbi:hypothetical protein, partial [Bradyrhizobium cajani]|uniref:hypothetical protein n=1 Tax=Bradyrhizobium cajani TaxID=1928661 RepID=UPI00197AA7F6